MKNMTSTKIKNHSVSQDDSVKQLQGLSPRIIIMVLIAIVVLAAVQVRGWDAQLGPALNEFDVPNTGALAIILIMLGMNQILKKTKFKLKPHEMVVMYIAVTFVLMVAGTGYVTHMINAIMGPWYLILTGNDLKGNYQAFLDKIPSFLVSHDQGVAISFWQGGSSGVPWGAWIMPIIMWTILASAVLFLLFCITNLVREHWTNREHLIYPLVQPVLQTMTETESIGNIWNNKIALSGIILSAAIGIFNIIASYFPVIPKMTLTFNLGEYFSEHPWNALADFPSHFMFGFNPLHVGIAYMLPSTISFSFWFFALAYKLENVFMNSIGYYSTSAETTLWWSWSGLARSSGAYIAIVIGVLWRARHSIKEQWLIATGRIKRDESNEVLTSRATIFGGIIALAFVLLFMKVLVGVPIYATLALVLCFLIYSLVIARLRAETGLPRSIAAPLEANHFAMNLLGPTWYKESIRGTGFLYYFSFGTATSFSAWMLEGYKLADEVNLKRRSMTKIIAMTFVLTALVASAVFLYIAYDYGAMMFEAGSISRAAKYNAWQKFDNYLNTHNLGNGKYWLANTQFLNHIIGFIIALFLTVMRTNFIWWPFHPIGYAFGLNTEMPAIWSYYLIAWLIKTLVTRFGGHETAKKIYPFFLGLIMGSAGVGAIYSLLGLFFPVL
jgi:large-conductance mechanosensitive channel